MEKIKVNMSPNPLDVQTIHASQNDGEARQWEFELHNNGELIDTSDVKEQLVFKAYKGGTEQLLPENTSTPTTSPFNGDIRYPQGLLTDQEFTYRQSPTEKDANARITDIKGNTLVWNQLLPSLASTKEWNGINITNNDDGSLTFDGTYTGTSTGNLYVNQTNMSILSTHWYLYDFSNSALNGFPIRISSSVGTGTLQGHGATINRPNADTNDRLVLRIPVGTTFNNVKVYPQIYDLTLMFGAEKALEMRNMEVNEAGSGVAYFRSLFPLSYYSYNQGSLLSFNGNEIKTVGKNQFNYDDLEVGSIDQGNGNNMGNDQHKRTVNFISVTDIKTYTSSNLNGRLRLYEYDANKAFITSFLISNETFTLASNCSYFRLAGTSTYYNENTQFEIGSTATSFEPYTTSTLSLPISTYFPTGMKSAGSVYDELTESKAITRMRRIDLGTLSFFYNSSNGFFSATIPDLVTGMTYATVSPNVIVQNYEYKGGGVGWANMPNMSYGFNGQDIRIKNTAYTTTADFINAVRGTYMVYELATYEETSFTTASLVTENAEIPLSNEDGTLIGKCTEQLSENPGFIDAKIKLADADGTCYSNKLQLHVERKPS